MDNVICMKWGTRYDANYVNRLAAGLRRHVARRTRFVCFTDNAAGIDSSQVEVRPLPEMRLDERLPERGWRKLTVFGPTLADLTGRALFLDLDILITADLSPFFELPGDFRIIRDWNLSGGKIGNSSVFRFEIGRHTGILDHWFAHGAEIRHRHRNEQAYLSWWMDQQGRLDYWPESWCLSFKRHCMRPFPLGYMLEPKRPMPETKIVVFHGKPNPHEVLDGWRSKWGLRAVRPAAWIRNAWTTENREQTRE